MSYNNNFNDNLVIQDNDDEYIQNNQEQKMVSNKDSKKNYEKQLYERIFVFGNFFGLVPKGFEKYFNLFAFHLTSVIVFAIFYRILMIDFYKNFIIPKDFDFDHNHFINHKVMIALFMSINFQSTVAYVDLKCKSFLTRLVIILQIISTFAITFLFFF